MIIKKTEKNKVFRKNRIMIINKNMIIKKTEKNNVFRKTEL